MDIEKARFNMVEQQIRPWEVLDTDVLRLFERRPRDTFVPEEYRMLAYADMRIPLEDGQQMMLPREEARLPRPCSSKPEMPCWKWEREPDT